ncbi:MAG: PAS domain-containing protein, partial [Chloroflexi bacterium]|nr:PAS domain-containing protein [Chloroflexota bacterium]
VLWSVLVVLCAAAFCCWSCHKRTDRQARRQARYVCIGMAVVVVVDASTDQLLPLFHVAVPEMASSAVIVGAVIIAYAIWKYDLFALTPATAAEEIVATMPEMMLLVGPDRRIAKANKAALTTLGYDEDGLVGQGLGVILGANGAQGSTSGGAELDSLLAVGTVSDVEMTARAKGGQRVPVLVSAA